MIHILPDSVANKIAAGEVVERPSSVVKELLENALDAGASRLDVYVEAGGRRLIRVEDDGAGMTRDDALLAFERHATSKIQSVDDLFEVSTLGFRGEALPSIASVSRVRLETRHASEPAGTQLEIHGGKLLGVKDLARVQGTRFEASGLFYNTPARRKFLKSESTELGHIAGLVTHYALAHPDKAFRLASMTHEILSAPPAESFRQRLYQIMGAQTQEQLVEIPPASRQMPAPASVEDEIGEADSSSPARVTLFGFASRPEVQKINRNQMYFFVNRRLVRDRLILHAVTEAYRNILPSGAFPVALIFIDLPPSEVDVNVHPAKTEVKFRHSSFIHDFARDTIRGALIASRPMASFPAAKIPTQGFRPNPAIEAAVSPPPEASRPPNPYSRPEPEPHEPSFNSGDSGVNLRLAAPQPAPVSGLLPLADGTAVFADEARAADAYAAQTSPDEYPRGLRPLGQVRESFIVATNDEGLWIIDQHVAHERVLFEQRLRDIQEKSVESQRLLLPVIVELKPQQQVIFQDLAQELAANGFEAEPFGQRTIAIKSAPGEISPEAAERLMLAILDEAGSEARGAALDDIRRRVAATVACHAAVKVNMPLTAGKMEWLLRALENTDCPMSCPHGRPILLRYSLRDIQKAFKRI